MIFDVRDWTRERQEERGLMKKRARSVIAVMLGKRKMKKSTWLFGEREELEVLSTQKAS